MAERTRGDAHVTVELVDGSAAIHGLLLKEAIHLRRRMEVIFDAQVRLAIQEGGSPPAPTADEEWVTAACGGVMRREGFVRHDHS